MWARGRQQRGWQLPQIAGGTPQGMVQHGLYQAARRATSRFHLGHLGLCAMQSVTRCRARLRLLARQGLARQHRVRPLRPWGRLQEASRGLDAHLRRRWRSREVLP